MEIVWYGHYCFRLSQRGLATVLADPFDSQIVGYKPIKTRADVVTVSAPGPEHGHVKGLRGVKKVLNAPGEYEIGGVFIIGLPLKSGKGEGHRLIFVYEYDGVTVAHLGGLDKVPSHKDIESIGPVDVVLIPVGGPRDGLNPSQAVDVISLIEPALIVPMAYKTPDIRLDLYPIERFLKLMGETSPQRMPSLKVTRSSLPAEPKLVLLEPNL